jgi:hypothetical protein
MWLRGLLVWLLLAGAETVHGTLRVLFLQPHLGDLRARQLALVTGMLVIVVITTLTIRWIGAVGARRQLALGAMWLALMAAFDVSLGRFVFGYSWPRIAEDFNPAAGGYLGIAMLVLLVAPRVAARLRRLS